MIRLFKKDLIMFFNDQRSFVLTFLVPIILITLFAFAYGGIGDYAAGSESLELLVVNQDRSRLSEEFISDLDSAAAVNVISSDLEKAKELIIKGKYASALVFKKGFQDSMSLGGDIPIELLYDREQEMETGHLQVVILNILMSYRGKIEMQKYINLFGSSMQVPDSTGMILSQSDGRGTDSFPLEMTSIVGEKNDHKLGLIQAVAGTAILMLLFSMAGVGTSILEEKENGTINRLLYSPLNSQTILYSKMLFAFFIAILQLSVMFLFSWIFLSLDITLNIPALVLMIVATAFAISSMGIFLAAISKSRQQAQNLSTLIILVMSAIGGSMIPLFFMPEIMNKFAVLSVNYWGIQGFYDIFWRSLPLSEILPKIIVLICTGVVMTILSIRLINKNILNLI
jgi:ABC-type Na+ efflux pump permease subunit